MWLVNVILLILLGVLGISSWLKTQQPKIGPQLGKLEAVEGWVGVVGLVWGIVMLLQWLTVASSILRYSPGFGLVSLITILVIMALSLILALPVLRTLFGSNDFTGKLGQLTSKLAPYKIGLGFSCLVLAIYTLIMLASFHAF